MPYLLQVGGDHRRKGIWFRWMGVFHCPVRPSSFPHLLPSLNILPLSPPPPPFPPSPPWGLPTVPKPWDHLFMPGWHYLSQLSTLLYIPAYSPYFWVANTHQRSVCLSWGVSCNGAHTTRYFLSINKILVCGVYCLASLPAWTANTKLNANIVAF